MTTFANNSALVEALYVGYFGRAGDPVGMSYWIGQLNAGSISLPNLAASFATQTEAKTKYPYLAAPNVANPTEFINQVYQNLFNRLPDAAGLAYWSAQLTAAGGNPVAIGNFILNVMSGATGTDNTTLLNKQDVASDFTTKAANANTSWTASVQAQSAAEIAATTSDPATVTTQKAATTTFIASAPGVELPLTINTDNLSSGATNAAFMANLFTVPTTGALLQTLTPGDTLAATGTGASLVATLNASTALVNNVTMSGISRADFVVTGATAVTGSATGITGLTTVNNTGSTAGLTLGAAGNGLKTALSTINVNSPAIGATGNLQSAIIAAAALSGAADTLNVNLTGSVGAAGVVAGIRAGTDGAAGTAATPQNAYETINLAAAGASFVNLSGAGNGGVLSTTTLNLSGAGATSVFQQTAGGGDFSKVTTIDATKNTGGVTVTGATTAAAAGASGFLTGNTALTSFKGGTGNDSLDISSFTTTLAGFTAGNLDGGTGRDTLILDASRVSNTPQTIAATGFEIVQTNAGLTGAVDISKLGTGVDTLGLLGAAGGNVTISNGPAAFTLALGTFGADVNYTVGGAAGTSDTLGISVTTAGTDEIADLITTAYETVGITVSAGGTFEVNSITSTPTVGGGMTLNIVHNNGAATGQVQTTTNVGGGGAINLSGTGTAAFTFTGAVTAGVLNASTYAGSLVQGANPTGAITITGTGGNDTLLGSAANDTIVGGAGTDTITANGGADSVTGGAGVDTINQGIADSVASTAQSIAAATIAAGDSLTFGGGVDVVNGFSAGTGGDVMNVLVAGSPVTLIGATAADLTAGQTVFFASGNFNASTGVFSITNNGVGADTAIVQADNGVAASDAIATNASVTILVGVNSNNLVNSNFV